MMSEVVELDELKIPLEDIRSATNNFAKENFIGGGGFGSVYRGKLQRSDGYLAVAVKRLDPDNGQGEHEFRNEIELLSCYKHENVVSLIGFCEEDGEMILVYEYAVHESLYKQLKDGSTRLTWEQRLTICIGVAHGLEYLHTRVGSQHRVIHRDIKSSNILLDKHWEAKIADFGLSKIGPANQGNSVVMSNLAGTAGYCDPEYVDFGILSKESDVYSFGVVLFEVLSGNVGKMSLAKWAKRCYKDDRLDNVTDNSLSDHIKPESLRIFADIAFLCLKSRREERPTIGRVVEALENALKTQLGVKTDNICFWWAPALRMYLKKLHIPDYILLPDLEPEATESTDGPSCPVLVFINSKCGGHLGVNLLATYRSLTLIKDQIFDLEQESPDVVLRRLYLNLERLKVHGDKFALVVQERLRIIVAGDDETTNWLVGVVSDLRLSRPPPIAAVPLGIENNLSFAFGWGKKNPGTDRASVFSFLDQVWTAKEMAIDSWHILMRMRVPTTGSHDPIAPLELPRSLHGFHRISSTDDLNMDGYDTFRGGFWNYFSIGMDAELSYTFHSEQKLHPEKYKNQLPGQGRRAKLKSFIASRFLPSSRNIAQLTKVKIMGGSRQWMELNLPHSIRTIVCLNLPSFAGGLNPWGTPSQNLSRDRDLTPPYVDDGLLEIVGFKDAGNGLGFLASKGYGIRFAQARRIRFEFHKSAAEYTYMRIDGEAWKQPLPTDDDSVVIEISHGGQVKMLASEDCRSRSINDPLSPLADYTDGEDSDDEEDDPSIEEVRRKFGAADSFKVPHEVDISHLS